MSATMMNQIWNLALPLEQAWVLMAYADHAAPDGSCTFASLAYIAWKTGFSRRYVQRVTKALLDAGVLAVVEHGGGRGRPTVYRIVLACAPHKPNFVPRSVRDPDRSAGLPYAADKGEPIVTGSGGRGTVVPRHQAEDQARDQAGGGEKGEPVVTGSGGRGTVVPRHQAEDQARDQAGGGEKGEPACSPFRAEKGEPASSPFTNHPAEKGEPARSPFPEEKGEPARSPFGAQNRAKRVAYRVKTVPKSAVNEREPLTIEPNEKEEEEDREPPLLDPAIAAAICAAYDAEGIMLTKSHLDLHAQTIGRLGLPAWQAGWAAAVAAGRHNMPMYVMRCAESAYIRAARPPPSPACPQPVPAHPNARRSDVQTTEPHIVRAPEARANEAALRRVLGLGPDDPLPDDL